MRIFILIVVYNVLNKIKFIWIIVHKKVCVRHKVVLGFLYLYIGRLLTSILNIVFKIISKIIVYLKIGHFPLVKDMNLPHPSRGTWTGSWSRQNWYNTECSDRSHWPEQEKIIACELPYCLRQFGVYLNRSWIESLDFWVHRAFSRCQSQHANCGA
jgi:hypothetical protein